MILFILYLSRVRTAPSIFRIRIPVVTPWGSSVYVEV